MSAVKRTDHYPRDPWGRRVFAYWLDRVPENVALSQTTYERYALAYRMHRAGFTYPEIAQKFGFKSRNRAWEMVQSYKYRRERLSPVERFFSDTNFRSYFTSDTKRLQAKKWARTVLD